MELTLRKPTLDDKEGILKYQAAFVDKESIHGSSFLTDMQSFEEWLEYLQILENKATAPNNLVPSEQFILVDDNNSVIGMINLRLELNDYLANFGGHVGYSIIPAVEGMGFGTKQLGLLLPIAKEKGLDRLLLICDDNNIGSSKVIEKNGGQLHEVRLDESKQKQIKIYWIELTDE